MGVGAHERHKRAREKKTVILRPRQLPVAYATGRCVVPNSDPCQVVTPLVLIDLGLGVG